MITEKRGKISKMCHVSDHVLGRVCEDCGINATNTVFNTHTNHSIALNSNVRLCGSNQVTVSILYVIVKLT